MKKIRIRISRTAGAVIGGGFLIIIIIAGLAFGQGFFDRRIGIISPEDGDCIYRNTKTASEAVVTGGAVPVTVATIIYGNSVRGGHLWAGDRIDIDAPPTGIRERFSFVASGSLADTLLSIRTGPAWNWVEPLNIITTVGTYTGHLWRQRISKSIDTSVNNAIKFQRAVAVTGRGPRA